MTDKTVEILGACFGMLVMVVVLILSILLGTDRSEDDEDV